MTQGDEEFLTPEQSAGLIGVSRRTLERYVARGWLTKYTKGFRTMYLKREVEEAGKIRKAEPKIAKSDKEIK